MRRVVRSLTLSVLALVLAAMTAGTADKILVWADKADGKKVKDKYVYMLEGHVVVHHGKTIIHCDHAVYDEAAGMLTATGGVDLANEDIKVEAQELVYLRDTKEGTFRGGVQLVRDEQKDAGGQITKDAFKLICTELIFAAEKKNFTARSDVSLTHKDTRATAGELVYDDERQQMRLRGQPVLSHEDEEVKAEEILIDIEADTFTITKAEISFTVGEKEETATAEKETGGSPATNGASTPPGP